MLTENVSPHGWGAVMSKHNTGLLSPQPETGGRGDGCIFQCVRGWPGLPGGGQHAHLSSCSRSRNGRGLLMGPPDEIRTPFCFGALIPLGAADEKGLSVDIMVARTDSLRLNEVP